MVSILKRLMCGLILCGCAIAQANLPSGTTASGTINYKAIAAPSTPASGRLITWSDSTSKIFCGKNDAGTLSCTVVPSSAPSHQFFNSLSAGLFGSAQPAFSDISGTLGCSQFPTITGDASNSACAFTITALHLSPAPTLCSSGNYSRGIDANGNATGCTAAATGGILTNGQILIGDTGNPPQANTVTAGAGIGVANGPHTITISATGSSCSAGSPALVGSASATAPSPTLVTATLACSGSLVVIAIQSLSSATNPLTITGSCVTGWTLAKSSVANTQKGWVYYGTSNTTGACTISSNVTCSACSILEAEFANASAVVDQSFADYSNGTSSITTSIPALSRTNDVVFSSIGGGLSSGAFTATAPLANIVGWNPISGKPQELGWYQATGASTQSFNWGISCCGSSWWNDILLLNVAFTTASGSAVFNQSVQVDGTSFPQEPGTQYVSGTGITLSGADDSANGRTKVTITRDALTGDVTTSGDAATLASVVTAGSCGDTTHSCGLTYDAKGRITAASNNAISGAGGGSAALVLLCSGTASSSSTLDFSHTSNCSGVNPFTATYDDYEIRITHLVMGTANTNVLMLFSTDGGTTYDTGSNYTWVGFRQSVAGTANNVGTNGTGGTSGAAGSFGLDVNGGITATSSVGSFRATIDVADPFGGTGYTTVTDVAHDWDTLDATNHVVIAHMSGAYKSATAVNAFRIKASSGNLASGFVRVYGITH